MLARQHPLWIFQRPRADLVERGELIGRKLDLGRIGVSSQLFASKARFSEILDA